MKEEEIIKKLKKSDRVEYIVRKERIEKRNQTGLLLMIVKITIFAAIVLVFITLELRDDFTPESGQKFAESTEKIFKVLQFFIIMAFLFDLYMILRRIKLIKELNAEFIKPEKK